jgi:predicted phosphoribosyltransferase
MSAAGVEERLRPRPSRRKPTLTPRRHKQWLGFGTARPTTTVMDHQRFRDRSEAGCLLAEQLHGYARGEDVVVLGLPRGGVPVAFEIARALDVPLDVFLVRKLGVPGHEELAFGAIATGGMRVLNKQFLETLAIPYEWIEAIDAKERRELERRERVYRGERPPPDLAGRTVILVDDGLATGATMLAAVGVWYEDFTQTSDDEVRELLERSRRPLPQVAKAIRRLTGELSDYDWLIERATAARYVLLGEASHGTHEFYRARAEITKRLIAESGFTAVAVEADWPDAYRVNRYVRGDREDRSADEALSDFRRFPVWMWRNAEVAEFVSLLREWNDTLSSETQRVGFYGLDLYSLRRSMEAVIEFLDELDPEGAKRARERYACFDQFGRDPQVYAYDVPGRGRELESARSAHGADACVAHRASRAHVWADEGGRLGAQLPPRGCAGHRARPVGRAEPRPARPPARRR